MGRRKSLIIFLAIATAIAYSAYALTRPLPAASAHLDIKLPAPQPASLAWPAAQSAFGAEGFGLLASHGNQKPVPVASTAKLVTILAVLHKFPLQPDSQGPTITLGSRDVSFYQSYQKVGGSLVKVQPGEQITERQAIEAMLLPSANNIAESLAIWAFGSMQNYLEFANKYALQLGLTETHMADASGFSPNTTSTASDLVRLGLLSLQNPVISDIVGEKSTVLPIVGTVYNVNWLLGSDGIDGIKTGNSDQAGGCYLFSATHDVSGQPVTVVGAVVGAADLKSAMTDGAALNSSAASNFSYVQLAKSGESVGRYSTVWGSSATIATSQPIAALIWNSSPGTLKQNNSQLIWQQTSTQKHTIDITPPSVVSGPSLAWRLTHPTSR